MVEQFETEDNRLGTTVLSDVIIMNDDDTFVSIHLFLIYTQRPSPI